MLMETMIVQLCSEFTSVNPCTQINYYCIVLLPYLLAVQCYLLFFFHSGGLWATKRWVFPQLLMRCACLPSWIYRNSQAVKHFSSKMLHSSMLVYKSCSALCTGLHEVRNCDNVMCHRSWSLSTCSFMEREREREKYCCINAPEKKKKKVLLYNCTSSQ